MRIERDGIQILNVKDWETHAGPKSPDQWRRGRSAYECASAWCSSGAPRVPDEIQSLLDGHPDTAGYCIVSAIPEHPVRFDSLRGEPRNADLVVLARRADERIAISVEAKADESFDMYVGDLAADAVDRIAHGESTGALLRLEGLVAALLPPRKPRAPKLGGVRYQLLTATAGALAYAIQEKTAKAVLIVHEFMTDDTCDEHHRRNSHDLDAFLNRLSGGAIRHLASGSLAGPFLLPGRPLFSEVPALYIGKVSRNLRAQGTS